MIDINPKFVAISDVLKRCSISKKATANFIVQLEDELSVVLRWRDAGLQFNLSQWVRDNHWQRQILATRPLDRWLVFYFYLLGAKNSLLVLRHCVLWLLLRLCFPKNDTYENIDIAFTASGKTHRVVSVKPKLFDQNRSQRFIVDGRGNIETKFWRHVSLSDAFSALLYMLKAFKHWRQFKGSEVSVFAKEVLDHTIFQFAVLAFYCRRNLSGQLLMPSEGFPREALVEDIIGSKLTRVNLSPFLNFARVNTFFWRGNLEFEYLIADSKKRKFLTRPNPLLRNSFPLISLEAEILKKKPSGARIVVACGYSRQSARASRELYRYLNQKFGGNCSVVFKDHPRRKLHTLEIFSTDLLISCTSTTLATDRYLAEPRTNNMYVVLLDSYFWHPSPYHSIPLAVFGCSDNETLRDSS